MFKSRSVALYGGLIILGGLASTVVNGGVFYTFGIFFKPVMADLGWSRSQFSAVNSVFLVAYAPGAIFLGRLCDRYGSRLPMAGAALLIGSGLALSSRAHELSLFLIGYALVGLGVGATLTVPSAVVQRWFVKGRGVALGVVSAGMGVGAMVFAPLANRLIFNYGWHSAYLILALIFGCLLALSALFLFPKPNDTAVLARGKTKVASEDERPLSVSRVMRTGTFLGIVGVYILSFAPTLMITAHLVPCVTDRGVSPARAAEAMGMIGAVGVVGRLILGSLGPRTGWMRGVALSNFACAVAVVLLAALNGPAMLYPFVLIYGFFYGGRMPQLMGGVASFFGTASLGILLGVPLGISTMVGAITPLLGGYLFDRTGSYTIALAFAIASLVSAGMYALILKAPRRSEEET